MNSTRQRPTRATSQEALGKAIADHYTDSAGLADLVRSHSLIELMDESAYVIAAGELGQLVKTKTLVNIFARVLRAADIYRTAAISSTDFGALVRLRDGDPDFEWKSQIHDFHRTHWRLLDSIGAATDVVGLGEAVDSYSIYELDNRISRLNQARDHVASMRQFTELAQEALREGSSLDLSQLEKSLALMDRVFVESDEAREYIATQFPAATSAMGTIARDFRLGVFDATDQLDALHTAALNVGFHMRVIRERVSRDIAYGHLVRTGALEEGKRHG